MGVFTQVTSNIKGFAHKFARKFAYASCVNGALPPHHRFAHQSRRAVQRPLRAWLSEQQRCCEPKWVNGLIVCLHHYHCACREPVWNRFSNAFNSPVILVLISTNPPGFILNAEIFLVFFPPGAMFAERWIAAPASGCNFAMKINLAACICGWEIGGNVVVTDRGQRGRPREPEMFPELTRICVWGWGPGSPPALVTWKVRAHAHTRSSEEMSVFLFLAWENLELLLKAESYLALCDCVCVCFFFVMCTFGIVNHPQKNTEMRDTPEKLTRFWFFCTLKNAHWCKSLDLPSTHWKHWLIFAYENMLDAHC